MDSVRPNGLRRSLLLTLVSRSEIDFEEKRKRLLMALFLCVGIPAFYGFAAMHLIRGNQGNFASDFLVGTALAVSLVVLRRLRRGAVIFRINAGLLGLRLLYLLAIGGAQGSRSLFMFVFPLIAFFLLGKREGGVWIGLFFAAALTILFLPFSFLTPYEYVSVFKIRFLISFVLVSAMAFIFESVRHQFQLAMEKAQHRLQMEKEKLAESDRALRYFRSLVDGKTITISEKTG